tara:strand:+ start:94690 stop:95913 length:1224 start_codon:yes stop_codon:yes gene_type:complete
MLAMRTNFLYLFTIFLCFQFHSCHSQTSSEKNKEKDLSEVKNNIVGGPFENGEFMYHGIPETLKAVDTSPGWKQEGQKLLITGKILKPDGKTPAANVILYYYHTNTEGYYAPNDSMDKRASRHGYIRGWVQSDSLGNYSIYTVRPGAYPNRNDPAHIHPSIKEPTLDKEYYIDAFVFDDDPLLTTKKRLEMENRGGSGILRLLKKGDLHIAEHNIILGLNIPNHPSKNNEKVSSGSAIGEDVISFTPFHAWGPDKGSKTCPVCKYGRYHGILYFVGNDPNWDEIKQWLSYLENESAERSSYLKTYFVYGNEGNYDKDKITKQLAEIGKSLQLEHTALTFVPSFNDTSSAIRHNKINPNVENTFLIYKHSTIIDKYVNLKPTTSNYNKIKASLDRTTNNFQLLPTIHQ